MLLTNYNVALYSPLDITPSSLVLVPTLVIRSSLELERMRRLPLTSNVNADEATFTSSQYAGV